MPNAGIHLCIARRLAKKVNMDKYLFYVGNIAPDSWRNSSSTRRISHFRTESSKEDYEAFYKKYQKELKNPYVMGYLTHLITDNYWYEHKYLGENKDAKYKEGIYCLVSNLTSHYKVEKLNPLIMDIFYNPIEELNESGINKTIDYINKSCFIKKPRIYDITELKNQIEETSDYILNELDRLQRKYK